MIPKHHTALQVGDTVTWYSPDMGLCQSYRVQEIVTPTGYLIAEDDVLIITDDATGHCEEVYVSELV